MAGTAVALRRYPVKSMLGEELPSVEVAATGLAGDRGWALLDAETGRVASAKSPRLWRDLLTMSAVADGDGVRIVLPDGRTVRSGDARADAELSEALGRRVTLTDTRPEGATLARAVPDQVLAAGITAEVEDEEVVLGQGSPPGTFVDFAPVHLVGTATLAAIAEAGERGVMEAARYRPNIVLDTGDGAGFGENDWVGRDLRVGEAVLRVMAPTPRCSVPTLEHGTLPRDTGALRIPARLNLVEPVPGMGPRPCAGVYAQVVTPGRVNAGDPFRLL
ncbi:MULTISPECIES: MOSC domain-containing protein [Actinomadura]|uniref:MOSC domain-containing protein n=2 Tax=Actinomadura yumaensis TaxID=111807 RepID=A0ABW2CJ08_9ACTN|nr:MOSC N-terminal beta barrel domain-containing protein [Actinomadura sp. J1-007]MWK38560.1 MOSC domain-containing protein [Actinomadura sp. J1-007]